MSKTWFKKKFNFFIDLHILHVLISKLHEITVYKKTAFSKSLTKLGTWPENPYTYKRTPLSAKRSRMLRGRSEKSAGIRAAACDSEPVKFEEPANVIYRPGRSENTCSPDARVKCELAREEMFFFCPSYVAPAINGGSDWKSRLFACLDDFVTGWSVFVGINWFKRANAIW